LKILMQKQGYTEIEIASVLGENNK